MPSQSVERRWAPRCSIAALDDAGADCRAGGLRPDRPADTANSCQPSAAQRIRIPPTTIFMVFSSAVASAQTIEGVQVGQPPLWQSKARFYSLGNLLV